MDETDLKNMFLEGELAAALREGSFTKLEKIPEVRALMVKRLEEKTETARLAESLNHLPLSDIQKLFEDYIEERFDAHLQIFFDRLHVAIASATKRILATRLKAIEDSLLDLKRSVLMASLQPNTFVEAEIIQAIHKFISVQPGCKATLMAISQHLIYDIMLPVPGVDSTSKYKFVLNLLKHDDCVRELDGFLYELVSYRAREECDGLVTSRERRTLLQQIASLRNLDEGADDDPS